MTIQSSSPLTIRCDAGVKHLGDVGMIHEDERLAFLLEADLHTVGVQAGLAKHEGNAALHQFRLIGDADRSETGSSTSLKKHGLNAL